VELSQQQRRNGITLTLEKRGKEKKRGRKSTSPFIQVRVAGEGMLEGGEGVGR